jgi:hypothetical protein
MGETDRSAEFEKFAKGEGRKVENGGVVMFGGDEATAQSFAHKARKAGFQVLVGLTQAQWVHGNEDPSNWPKEWGVNLLN